MMNENTLAEYLKIFTTATWMRGQAEDYEKEFAFLDAKRWYFKAYLAYRDAYNYASKFADPINKGAYEMMSYCKNKMDLISQENYTECEI